jgi:hypothetical protein
MVSFWHRREAGQSWCGECPQPRKPTSEQVVSVYIPMYPESVAGFALEDIETKARTSRDGLPAPFRRLLVGVNDALEDSSRVARSMNAVPLSEVGHRSLTAKQPAFALPCQVRRCAEQLEQMLLWQTDPIPVIAWVDGHNLILVGPQPRITVSNAPRPPHAAP